MGGKVSWNWLFQESDNILRSRNVSQRQYQRCMHLESKGPLFKPKVYHPNSYEALNGVLNLSDHASPYAKKKKKTGGSD